MTQPQTTRENCYPNTIDTSGKRFLQLSFPVMVSFLAQNFIGIVDTAFISRIGEVELGGTAMAGLVYFCIYTVGFGLSSGTQILIGHHYGADRREDIGHILGQSTLLLVIIGLLISLTSLPFGKWLFPSMLSSQDVAGSAVEYWNWRIPGFAFAFGASAFRAFFIGTSDTKVLTYTSVVMSVVNILLDWVLIFGHLGVAAMGVKGAALASVVAEVAALTFYLIYFGHKISFKEYGVSMRTTFKQDLPLIKQLYHLSIYLVLQALLSQSVWTVFFFFIESLGERELAIAAIIRSIYILLFIPINSYGTAVRSTVSHIFGAEAMHLLKSYLWLGVRISLTTVLTIIVLVNLFPEPILNVFSDDASLIKEAVPSLRVVTIAMIACSIGGIFFASVGSTGATKTVFLIELFSIILYLSYAAMMVYIIKAPVWACFTVEIIYYVTVALLSIRFVYREDWKKAIIQ